MPDVTAPQTVVSLVGAVLGPTTARLSWNTPGDDGATGTLAVGSEYRIEQTTNAAYVSWSTTTAQVVISTNGVAPGIGVIRDMTGLTAENTYYFRLWTRDEAGNWS